MFVPLCVAGQPSSPTWTEREDGIDLSSIVVSRDDHELVFAIFDHDPRAAGRAPPPEAILDPTRDLGSFRGLDLDDPRRVANSRGIERSHGFAIPLDVLGIVHDHEDLRTTHVEDLAQAVLVPDNETPDRGEDVVAGAAPDLEDSRDDAPLLRERPTGRHGQRPAVAAHMRKGNALALH
ncbi:MAG TPA: hypothetical protein VFF73_01650, partial [Planctomycetota bacterium]|nr:hypothetical protein [Planctomycetota bacterium]